MKNLFKIGILISLFIFISGGFCCSLVYKFEDLAESFEDSLVGIHFKGGKNNFGGMLFVTNEMEVTPRTLSLGSDIVENCNKKLEGFYYNSQRGGRNFPLNKELLNRWKDNFDLYTGLEVSGGLYTSCDNHPASVYGQISYTYNSNQYFKLQTGRGYYYEGNSITGDNFRGSFQKIENQLVGFIYDEKYGIGFVGGKVKEGFKNIINKINEGFLMKDIIKDIKQKEIVFEPEGLAVVKSIWGILLKSKIGIKGLYSVSNSVNNSDYKEEVKKIGNQKEAVLGGDEIVNVNKILNKTRKKVYSKCKGKRIKSYDNIIGDNSEERGEILCYDTEGKGAETFYINEDITSDGNITSIAIQGGESDVNKVIFKEEQEGPGHINMYLDKGYMLLDNGEEIMQEVDGKGYALKNGGVTSGAYLRGNFIINGLLGGVEKDSSKLSKISHKLYIHGSIASYNTLVDDEDRKELVENSMNLSGGMVNIKSLFDWRCNASGLGTDGVYCGSSDDDYAHKIFIAIDEILNNYWLR